MIDQYATLICVLCGNDRTPEARKEERRKQNCGKYDLPCETRGMQNRRVGIGKPPLPPPRARIG